MTKSFLDDVKPVLIIGGVIGAAVGSYFIIRAVAEGIQNFSYGASKSVENVSEGVENALTGLNSISEGAGNFLTLSGLGVQSLGAGIGGGIYEIGEGLGGGLYQLGVGGNNFLTQSGAGIFEIGSGAGYALSGANIQDIVQTIFTLGKDESSNYQSGGNPVIHQADIDKAFSNYMGQTQGTGGNTTTFGNQTSGGNQTPTEFRLPTAEESLGYGNSSSGSDKKQTFSLTGNVVSDGNSSSGSRISLGEPLVNSPSVTDSRSLVPSGKISDFISPSDTKDSQTLKFTNNSPKSTPIVGGAFGNVLSKIFGGKK